MKRREEILIEALPYIREFYGCIIVIKIGGHALVDDEIMESIVKDVVLLRYVGMKPVIVHGGGPEVTRMMKKLGKEAEFIGGLRVTDDETMEIAKMVLVGSINEKIVSLIGKQGAKGIGISGNDGNLIIAEKKTLFEGDERIDIGWVGEIKKIEPEIINIVAENGYIPVISPIAMDEKGNSLNVNADTVAGEIAISLKAKKLIILTDVPGLLRDVSDDKSVISVASPDEIEKILREGKADKGMIPKLKASMKASRQNVVSHIIDGRRPHSILLELFTDEGIGTMIKK